MEKEHFFVKVIGIVFDTTERKILVGKKKGDENYSFVEGELHHDLELDKCLKKTIKEKTGYSVHNLGSMYSENGLKDETKLNLYFLCEIREGREKAGAGIEELRWIDPCKAEEIMKTKFPSRLKEFIDNLGIACNLD